MTLKLFNTLTRKKEEFKPLVEGKVGLYTCGPTVYNFAHIGNLRAMITYDLLKRYLNYKKYEVKHVMNITDIDDKTIRNSQKEGKSLKEFTEFYTHSFLEDLKKLNIQIPEIMPKATEEIQPMVDLIKTLLEKNIAYKADNGDIYFSISKFKDYGKMALIDPEKLKNNADGRLNNADEYDKEDARDFALWKHNSKEDGGVFWETEIGKGRPGWHIECSVMSSKYLGQPFDIHMGGVDLIFPHHTNEIAQSEAGYGTKFCNYWIHNEHLMVNGEKMSKSLGNFYTLRDLEEKKLSYSAIRYELLSTHYRVKMNFTIDNVKSTKNILNNIKDFILKLKDVSNDKGQDIDKILIGCKNEFESSLDNDLNMSGALASLHTLMNKVNKIIELKELSKTDAIKIINLLKKQNEVYGFISFEEEIPIEIRTLAEQRLQARKDKNWKLSDELRDKIKEKGYIIDDTKEGYRLKKE